MADGTERPEELPEEVTRVLDTRGILARDEASLRAALEGLVPGYTLVRMMPAAARRWKARYRILIGDAYYDAQTAPEAYARALLAVLASQTAQATETASAGDAIAPSLPPSSEPQPPEG